MKVSLFGPVTEDPMLSVHLHAEIVVRFLRMRGVDVEHVRFSRRKIALLPASLAATANRFLLYPLHAARHRARVNHIFDHFYSHLVFALGASRTVISCNSMTMPKIARRELPLPPIPWRFRATHALRYRAMLRARAVCVATHAGRADVERIFRQPSSRLFVVNEGVDHDVFHPVQDAARLAAARRAHGLESVAEPITLVVGTPAGFKNRITSLRVFTELIRRKVDTHLVFVGASLSPEESALIHTPALRGRVTHLEFVTTADLVCLYNIASVMLFPSWDEGFGHPPLEAMACGTPTVTSDIPVLLETTGDAALHAPPGDVMKLADRAGELLGDAALRASFRTRGIARAGQYTWERYAREIAEVYQTVADA